MEIPKTWSPPEIENRWYKAWEENGLFHSEPDDREPYTIVIPPPNVTGILHMGHALNNTVQDIIIRRARMQGYNALWVPGTDHASIATEAKVVGMLKERGIEKRELTREQFLSYAWEWNDKYGGIILQQLRKLGASCDWQRTAFTMSPNYYKSVIRVFVDLYRKGHIYRGTQMINWDPKAQTSLSDEEVIYKDVRSKLYYIKYPIQGTDEFISIATTRPETLLGDTAVCVNPQDERYTHLLGKKAIVPLVDRPVPIIADDYVDKEFGTGALKVTPAHDKNDYALGQRHKLKAIDVFTPDGKISEAAEVFVGIDKWEARKRVVKELEEKGLLLKIEEINNSQGFSERNPETVVEPRLSMQWFCRMNEMADPALKAVMEDEVKFHPAKFKNTYRYWMENIRDWCISRQLWWGQRIPAWYVKREDGSGKMEVEIVVAENEEEALKEARLITENPSLKLSDLKQDEDVLDTWFSSWLWPIGVFNGILDPDNKDIQYYYPTQTLVTAPEIIFFWVARMIMSGFEYRDEKPFGHVYFTGIVRDKIGRKMSKQFGNSPDLLELIEKYGADGVRFGIMVSSPAGNDLLFDEKLCEQGRNFSNKIWNALRLVKGWESAGFDKSEDLSKPISWFKSRLAEVVAETEEYYQDFRLSEVLRSIYKLAWDDFCSTYLEMVKPKPGEKISQAAYEKTVEFFEEVLKLIHPFMPFITEDIWQQLKTRDAKDFCTIAKYPAGKETDPSVLQGGERVIEVVREIRNYRSEIGKSPKEAIALSIQTSESPIYEAWKGILKKLANISEIAYVEESPAHARSFAVKTDTFYLPKPEVKDAGAETEKLKQELEYTRGFLKSVQAKLANERFVQNAKPELIEKERQKLKDAETRIRQLEESLGQ